MVAVIVAEKPSAARNMAQALGGTTGSYQGVAFEIAHLRGHLYEFADPSGMVPADLAERYQRWDLVNLPWNPDDLTWKREPQRNAAGVIARLAAALRRADEVVIATDVDPSGEGDLLAWECIDELGFGHKRFSRMEFTDESPASIRLAFTRRRAVRSMQEEGAYRKALYRSQFDYLSMQFTRVATAMARQCGQDTMLRQGRLKSAMVKLVGDQLKAHQDYAKKPFFQNRFRDENGVIYTNPDEPRFETEAQVRRPYAPSPVVPDRRENKRTAPPKLLDLASLSALLVGRGVKAITVLGTYQRMYEDQVLSYPRTEDKTITPEQHKELAPLVDKIAAVVGVDPTLLTHRGPRTTHVKATGAHGANRPGPRVPGSLGELETRYGAGAGLIYETLAKSYLAMCAGDYLYEQQKGHLERYPDFTGTANVPQDPGWKRVFDPDAPDNDTTADDNTDRAHHNGPGDNSDDGHGDGTAGLGTLAEPFVYEGANKRPEHPSMRWLMKQLEKRDVGTGATRTSTYSEVTSEKTRYPLLVEKGKRLMLAEPGRMSWLLLPGTRIGDLGLTEQIYADMREIAAGATTREVCLARVADWVRADIEVMGENAKRMRSELGLSETRSLEKAEGTWTAPDGVATLVRFSRTWGEHTFTDEEVAALLRGEEITFAAISKAGSATTITGSLATSTYKGKRFIGFQKSHPGAPTSWAGHTFSTEEKDRLLDSERVRRTDFISKKGKRFETEVSWDPAAGKIVAHFDAVATDASGRQQPPTTWCNHQFTDDELSRLSASETVFVEGFVSAKGKPFDANVTFKSDGRSGERKRIVPSFQ
ncbi:DNA topoisomerase [Nocardioides sp. NBC_00368]|uniref:DNA topoisomerase n=1 Tax=Nocardioides sp. NBC_00368 TaxID=2976000 RepID=UPI002E21089E